MGLGHTVHVTYGIPFKNSKELYTWIQKHHKGLSSLPLFPKDLTVDYLSDTNPSDLAGGEYSNGVRLTQTLDISTFPAFVGYTVYMSWTDDSYINLSGEVCGLISIPKQVRLPIDEAFQQIGCPRTPQIYSVFGDCRPTEHTRTRTRFDRHTALSH